MRPWLLHAFRDRSGGSVSDEELVKKAKTGDQRAFEVLVHKYQQRLFALISRYVRDQDEVQDVAQEAFIKAWRALPRFRGDSGRRALTWMQPKPSSTPVQKCCTRLEPRSPSCCQRNWRR